MNDTSSVFEIIQATMLKSGNKLSVSRLCAMAGVSRSGYYNWLNAAPIREAKEMADQSDFELILQAYRFRGYDKGARGIHMRLLHLEPPVNMNIKKIRRLMRKYRLFCPIRKANPYRQMAKALKTSNYASNLLNRQFEAYGPRIVLLTDITYIPYNGVFAYLSVIMDAYTKQILAHVLSDSLEVDFVLETINQLIEVHGISLQAETILHSDQGCHYTSRRFIDLINDTGLRRSMSRRGNCWDNAPQESFFGHMKDAIGLTAFMEFEQIRLKVDDYIDYYNNDRYQWDLCKLSPNEYHEFLTTGIYPIKGIKAPAIPSGLKDPSTIGAKEH